MVVVTTTEAELTAGHSKQYEYAVFGMYMPLGQHEQLAAAENQRRMSRQIPKRNKVSTGTRPMSLRSIWGNHQTSLTRPGVSAGRAHVVGRHPHRAVVASGADVVGRGSSRAIVALEKEKMRSLEGNTHGCISL